MHPLNTCSYVLLDGARMGGDLFKAMEMNPGHLSLYRGRSEEALYDVAPYLFTFQPESEFGQWLLENGWGSSWGVFLQSGAPLEEMHRHLRQFLMVRTEGGEQMYWRFYDPRVLRDFLPIALPEQVALLFSTTVEAYWMEGEYKELLVFRGLGTKLIQEHLPSPMA